MSRASLLTSWCAACCALSVTGCEQVYPADPPPGTVIFPIAVDLVPSTVAGEPPPYLLLANSNYDVRWRQGTLQSVDLDRVAAAVDACPSTIDGGPPCVEPTILPFLTDEVLIGPHASGVAASPHGNRAYVSVRSESGMTWVDLDPVTGQLNCGNSLGGSGLEDCDVAHRDPAPSDGCGRTPELRGDVVGVVAGAVSSLTGDAAHAGLDYSVLVHRNGRASLFVDTMVGAVRVPQLVHVLEGLPTDATNVALDPARNLIWMPITVPPSSATPPRINPREVPMIGVAYDTDRPACSSAYYAGAVSLRGLDTGQDSRDVAFTDGGRFAHILSRTPNAVITVDTDGVGINGGDSLITEVTFVRPGAARIASGNVTGLGDIVVATCFDDRTLWVLDAVTGAVLATVFGLQGPQDLAIDGARGLVYVADFRDSVVRVVDLRPLAVGGDARVVLQLGTITAVRPL